MLLIFDSTGGLLEFDTSQTVPLSYSYLEPVSVGLVESTSLFLFEEYWNTVKNEQVYVRPLPEQGHTRQLSFSWLDTDNSNIYLYTVDNNQLVTIVDHLVLDCSDSVGTSWSGEVNNLPATAFFETTFAQINVALTSDVEESLTRTLQVTEIIDSVETIVCQVTFYGETEAEDQKYKILVNNFRALLNIDDEDSVKAFRYTDINESSIDYKIYNQKRKELLLAGNEIIPYMGSYKGLINAINFFGYSDMRIREYWLNIDKASPTYNKYLYVDIKNQSGGKLNTSYELLPLDRFQKTSLFGLFYDLNTVVPYEYDQFGIPVTVQADLFSPEEVIIKLFALQNKLKKDFLPLNAKIVDIVGEGIYFELYQSKAWVSEIQTRDFSREFSIDFSITTPLGSNQLNAEKNLHDFIYDLRPLQVNWNTLPVFDVTLSYLQYTIVSYQNEFWLSNIAISPGSFNPSHWTSLTGINSLQDITAANPTFNNVPIEAFSSQLLAYFSEIKGNLLPFQWPDAENIAAGCPVVLDADFGGITWEDGDSTWDTLYGDTKSAEDYDSTVTYQIGDYTRFEGLNYVALTVTTGSFNFSDWDQIQSISYSWDSINNTDLYEMTWIVTNSSHNYSFEVTGLVNPIVDVSGNIITNSLKSYPLVLPYIGNYTIELRGRTTYNEVIYKKKYDILNINSKQGEFICFSYFLDSIDLWDDSLNDEWAEISSVWQLPCREAESSDWDSSDLDWTSTDFAKYINNMPANQSLFFGYEAYFWDNFSFNDWNELSSTTWGMLEEKADNLGGFDIIVNEGDFSNFNSNTNAITIGNSTYTVNVTINSYQDLADWLMNIDSIDFNKFIFTPFTLDSPDRVRASAKFEGEYGYYKDWTLDGYNQDLNNQGAVSLSGDGWSLIWDSEMTWNQLQQEWTAESPVYDSIPNNLHDASEFILPPITVYNQAFTMYTMVPIFIVPDNCEVPGKTNFHWEIWDDEKGYMLYQINHPFVIWTFQVEGIYTIKMSCYDSNGNYAFGEKIGYITVITKSQVNPYTRAQRVDGAIDNMLTGIEYSYVIESSSTPFIVI